MKSHGEQTMESQIREAIITELRRQSEEPKCDLRVEAADDRLKVNGTIDLDALAFVIAGSLAGGP